MIQFHHFIHSIHEKCSANRTNVFTERGKWKRRKEDHDPDYSKDDEDYNETGDADGIPDAAKSNVEKQDEGAIEDEFGAKDYRSQMVLKPDNASRPLWVVRTLINLQFMICLFRISFFFNVEYNCRHLMGTSF